MTGSKLRTIWLPCLPACLLPSCRVVSFHRRPDWQRPCRVERGRWARLSDGCPIHHGGPWWWAKEPTCGGEGEVVSEESALLDYSRSIIPTRAAQNLSVCWQLAEWLLPLWAKREVLTKSKRLWKGQTGWYRLEDLGNQHYHKQGLGAGSRIAR